MALARKIHLKNALEEAVYSVKSNLTERNDIQGICIYIYIYIYVHIYI
jgi:hypothetical protein